MTEEVKIWGSGEKYSPENYQQCERCGELHFIHETCPPPPLGINVSEKTGSKEKIG